MVVPEERASREVSPVPTPSSCLSADAIAHYVQGKLSDDESEQLEEHVQECAACLETLSGQAENEPFFHSALSQAGCPSESPPPDADLAALKIRLKSLRQAQRTILEQPDPYRTRSESDRVEELGLGGETGWLGGFRIIEELGHGGMGAVFRAEDPTLNRHVAVKVMLPQFAGDRSARARFFREARSAATLQHDNVVPIYHVGEDRDIPYLVMPLLAGEPLDKRLRREPPLTLPESLRIGRELALGLAAAHARGLVHRDIKPANIWLEARDEGRGARGAEESESSSPAPRPSALPPRVKILDFGLARLEESPSGSAALTLPGSVMGTPEYLSPEQARGEHADFRSDLYNAGLILYRLTAGRLPFTAATPSGYMIAHASEPPPEVDKLNPNLPPLLAQTIMRLLQKNPADRLASAQELADTLGHLLQPDAGPTDAYSGAPVPRPRADNRWSRPLVALAAAAALLLAAFALWHFWPPAYLPVEQPQAPMHQLLITGIGRTENGEPQRHPIGATKDLAAHAPLKRGDIVALGYEIPHGFQSALFYVNAAGEVRELEPLQVHTVGATDRVRFPAKGDWQLDDPPGPVLFLACASRNAKPSLDEVRRLVQEDGAKAMPLPVPQEKKYLFAFNRVEPLEESRGVIETPYSQLRDRLERLRQGAADKFDCVWAVALPVR
jgi:serine/threonine protein kinase